MKSRYQITIYGINNDLDCYMDFNIWDMNDVIILLKATVLCSESERDFIKRFIMLFGGEKVIFAVNGMDQLEADVVPKVKEYAEKILDTEGSPS